MPDSISVIIPTYNRATRLLRALRSVLAQTCAPDEILVIDDGSTDETARLILDVPGVRYLPQSRRGVSAARNHGIRAARGKWLAFLDSDDQWLPEKLERQRKALAQSPDALICHTNEIWIRRGRRVNPRRKHAKSGGRIFARCLPLCVISPSSAMLHRSLFGEVGLFDETLPACEDYDLWLRICARYPVLYLEEPLIVKHGGHSDQLSRRFWGMDRFRIRALEKIVASGVLGPDDLRGAIETLVTKIDLYAAGARKRGKNEEAAAFETKRRDYIHRLEAPSPPSNGVGVDGP